MKDLIYIVLISLMMFLFTLQTVESENNAIHLNNQVDSLTIQIDSLKLEIDTLNFELQIWDFNITNNTTHLLSAIMFVESSYNDSAYHKGEDAVGCLQIRKCMVEDVNRILKKQRSTKRFFYEDRWNRNKSIAMFDIYCKYYNLNSAEEIARCWNGGPRGMQNNITAGYWTKVKNRL